MCLNLIIMIENSQSENTKSSVLSLLYCPTLTSIHDYWKNHSFDYMDLCWLCLYFVICCLGLYSFSSKEQVSFNFMAAITISNDFGAQENKICHSFHCSPSVFHCFPIYFPGSDRTRCYDICFFEC